MIRARYGGWNQRGRGGYRPEGSRSFESLLVGVFEGKGLHFAGKVRAGFTPRVRGELIEALRPHLLAKCPFRNLPDERHGKWGNGVTAEDMKGLRWAKPAVVVQVSFVEWTAEGRLRHASFIGMRTDKTPKDVRRES
jgi:bifunctional non-homologous end joining protein LigD